MWLTVRFSDGSPDEVWHPVLGVTVAEMLDDIRDLHAGQPGDPDPIQAWDLVIGPKPTGYTPLPTVFPRETIRSKCYDDWALCPSS